MSKAKLYRVSGYFRKGKDKVNMRVEVRALDINKAMEKVYSEIGSRHRVKRNDIFVDVDKGIEEISLEESKTQFYEQMDQEDFSIKVE